MGAITDISAQKNLEILHIDTVEQRALDAETHRQHIEQFIGKAPLPSFGVKLTQVPQTSPRTRFFLLSFLFIKPSRRL